MCENKFHTLGQVFFIKCFSDPPTEIWPYEKKNKNGKQTFFCSSIGRHQSKSNLFFSRAPCYDCIHCLVVASGERCLTTTRTIATAYYAGLLGHLRYR